MIRKMQETDIEVLAGIWLRTNLQAHHFIPESYWTQHVEAVKTMFSGAELYVCEEEGQLLGFIGLDGDYIAGLFVRSGAQSRGIGRQLLSFVKERKDQLSLSVYEKNARAVRFYQREGFALQGADSDKDTGEKEYRMIWRGRRGRYGQQI